MADTDWLADLEAAGLLMNSTDRIVRLGALLTAERFESMRQDLLLVGAAASAMRTGEATALAFVAGGLAEAAEGFRELARQHQLTPELLVELAGEGGERVGNLMPLLRTARRIRAEIVNLHAALVANAEGVQP